MSSQMKKNPTLRPVTSQPVTPPVEMLPQVLEAETMIRARDVTAVAFSGGVILQELAIRDPAHWAGGTIKLGERIREEVFTKEGNLKEKYVKAGNNIVKNLDSRIQPALLSSLILRCAAINLVTGQ